MSKKQLEAEIEALKAENERINQLAQKTVDDLLANADEQTKLMTESFQGEMKRIQEKMEEIQNKKEMMVLTVNITGVQDIPTTLNDAVILLKARLAAIELEDKYVILAIPSTMHIAIQR